MANEPLKYNAGVVTAYGAAVRGGYTGSYEDFCRQQAGYAESAAAVEHAKEEAVEAADTAIELVGGYNEMTVESTKLPQGSQPTSVIDRTGDHPVLRLGLVDGATGPQGPKGDKGDKGDQGIQGPKGDTGATGPRGYQGIQGPKGDTGATGPRGLLGPTGPKGDTGATGATGPKGDTGEDGFSPTVTVEAVIGGHTVTITDAEGDHPFNVMDGAGNVSSVNGETGVIVLDGNDINLDDTAATPEKITTAVSNLNRALTNLDEEKYEKPSGGIPASDLADGVIPEVPVQDVQVDGTSVVDGQGVADIPFGELADRKADVIIASASGAIASFSDGADDMPLKDCVVNIEPVQDLHGYNYPWPAGGGKNLVPSTLDNLIARNGAGSWNNNIYTLNGLTFTVNDDGSIKINGTASTTTYFTFIPNNLGVPMDAGDYICHETGQSGITMTVVKNGSYWISASLSNTTGSLTESANISFYMAISNDTVVNNLTVYPMFEKGTSESDYSPYSNICPITGWTGANVQRTGKNLWGGSAFAKLAENWTDAVIDTTAHTLTGNISKLSSRSKVFEMPFKQNVQYTVFMHADVSNTGLYVIYTDGTEASVGSSAFVTATNKTIAYLRFYIASSSNITFYYDDIGVFEGVLTADDFEPYQGHTYPINWQTEAGTVYGGYVDPVKGELVADRAIVDLGSLGWARSTSYTNAFFYSTFANAKLGGGCKCEQYKAIASTNAANFAANADNMAICLGATVQQIYIRDDRYTDATAFKTSLSNVHLVYDLATHQTYQLTPVEIRTILGGGINNIWADTGNVTVEYPADTKAYVDGSVPAVPVMDVQINGTSILQDGMANVPVSSALNYGAVRFSTDYGLQNINVSGSLRLGILKGSSEDVKSGSNSFKPIVPNSQHESTFYGLAKASGDTSQASSSNAVGTYTESAKSAISQMLDAPEIISGTTPSIPAKAGIMYVCGEVATLSITAPQSGIFDVVFTSGTTPTVLTTTGITFQDTFTPEANKRYEINVLDGYALVAEWAVSA